MDVTKFKRSCGFDEADGLQQGVSKVISSWVTNNSLILGQNSSQCEVTKLLW